MQTTLDFSCAPEPIAVIPYKVIEERGSVGRLVQFLDGSRDLIFRQPGTEWRGFISLRPADMVEKPRFVFGRAKCVSAPGALV